MKDMSPEEYDWHVKLVQERYGSLKVSYEQAEKIMDFENPNTKYSLKHSFSSWEEWEYEYYIFKKILKPKQFSIYKKEYDSRIKNLEKSYKKGDAIYKDQVEYQQAILEFSRTTFWPDLYKDLFLFRLMEADHLKLQRDYLKAVYKEYLKDLKIQLLSYHFREYKQTQPTHLKLTMLRFESSHLWPDYFSFEHTLDEPTKSIANILANMKIKFPDETESLIAKKIADQQIFVEALNKKYFKNRGGWTINIADDWDEFEKRKHIIMPLLLADKNEYGWKSPI